MALCPKCNRQELKAGESICPHCSNKRTASWLQAIGAAAAAAGALALAAAPVILSAVLKPKGGARS